MRGARLNQELATASLPRHMGILKQQYGAMAGPVLAEAVSGRAWGLVQVFPFFFCCLFFFCLGPCVDCVFRRVQRPLLVSRIGSASRFRVYVW